MIKSIIEGKVKPHFESAEICLDDIESVEIEVFSYCNRKCWFCPNSFIDRHSNNTEMPEKEYLHVLTQLKRIDYEGIIAYSRYNEPLSNKELILKRISQAREYLPKARLITNTNGDYLTAEYLSDLRKAGLNSLCIQRYLEIGEQFELDKLKVIFGRLCDKLTGAANQFCVVREEDGWFEVKLDVDGIDVFIRARDFRKNGCTRGGSLDTIPSYKRKTGCMIPFHHLYIDYNGNVMPCCNLRSDIAAHQPYIIGNVKEQELLEMLNRPKNIRFRKLVRLNPPHKSLSVCRGCNFF